MAGITHFVLCYGDHTPLARRCLESLQARLGETYGRVRVGLNAVSRETKDYIATLLDERHLRHGDVYREPTNVFKYPLMRKMFYDADNPISTPYVCWWDDDSFLRPGAADWERAVRVAMQDADMLGSLYTQRLIKNQHLWIQAQPWYTGQPVTPRHAVRFATGGWWTIRTDILRKHDWPIPELLHRGGDVMLGELCRQQDYRLKMFRTDVAINADAAGRESKSVPRAAREGSHTVFLGAEYQPPAVPAKNPPAPPLLELF